MHDQARWSWSWLHHLKTRQVLGMLPYVADGPYGYIGSS